MKKKKRRFFNIINYKIRLEKGCPAIKNKRKRAGIYTLILFFANFVKPYASKGACTALILRDTNFILINGLYRSRSLFLGQEVDYEIGNHIAGLMIFLSIEDANKDLYFFINSPGGLAVAGLVIYDTMQFVTPHVYTLGLGLAASMGSFLLVGGEITKRLASPNAWRQCVF